MTSASTQSTPADWYRIINTVWSSSLLQMSHTLCCVSSRRLSSATQTLKVSLGVFFSISGASWSRTRWAGAASSHPLTSAFTRFWLNLRVRVWFAPRGSGPVLLKSAFKKKETRHSRYSSASHLTVCSDFCLTRSAAPATTALQLLTVNCALISASG